MLMSATTQNSKNNIKADMKNELDKIQKKINIVERDIDAIQNQQLNNKTPHIGKKIYYCGHGYVCSHCYNGWKTKSCSK